MSRRKICPTEAITQKSELVRWDDRPVPVSWPVDCPYTLMGLSKCCTQSELRAAYRRAMFRYHPDRNLELSAGEDPWHRIVAAKAQIDLDLLAVIEARNILSPKQMSRWLIACSSYLCVFRFLRLADKDGSEKFTDFKSVLTQAKNLSEEVGSRFACAVAHLRLLDENFVARKYPLNRFSDEDWSAGMLALRSAWRRFHGSAKAYDKFVEKTIENARLNELKRSRGRKKNPDRLKPGEPKTVYCNPGERPQGALALTTDVVKSVSTNPVAKIDVATALAKLKNPIERKVAERRWMAGLTIGEVAEELGISEYKVKKILIATEVSLRRLLVGYP